MSKKEICAFFGCSMEQLNNQYKANAEQLEEMRKKAVALNGKKYRGFTAEQLGVYSKKYQQLSK